MISKQIKRRDFFKQIGVLFAGVFIFPIQRLFGILDEDLQKKNSPKEARYYTTSDDLAG